MHCTCLLSGGKRTVSEWRPSAPFKSGGWKSPPALPTAPAVTPAVTTPATAPAWAAPAGPPATVPATATAHSSPAVTPAASPPLHVRQNAEVGCNTQRRNWCCVRSGDWSQHCDGPTENRTSKNGFHFTFPPVVRPWKNAANYFGRDFAVLLNRHSGRRIISTQTRGRGSKTSMSAFGPQIVHCMFVFGGKADMTICEAHVWTCPFATFGGKANMENSTAPSANPDTVRVKTPTRHNLRA